MSFRSPVGDFRFILQHVVGFPEVNATERFESAAPDLVDAILREGAKPCDDALAALFAQTRQGGEGIFDLSPDDLAS